MNTTFLFFTGSAASVVLVATFIAGFLVLALLIAGAIAHALSKANTGARHMRAAAREAGIIALCWVAVIVVMTGMSSLYDTARGALAEKADTSGVTTEQLAPVPGSGTYITNEGTRMVAAVAKDGITTLIEVDGVEYGDDDDDTPTLRTERTCERHEPTLLLMESSGFVCNTVVTAVIPR